jgi:hypothetical protein
MSQLWCSKPRSRACAAASSKKRSLEEEGIDRPQKKVRISASSIETSARTAQRMLRAISRTEIASSNVNEEMQSETSISQFGRSGRLIRLLTQFRYWKMMLLAWYSTALRLL